MIHNSKKPKNLLTTIYFLLSTFVVGVFFFGFILATSTASAQEKCTVTSATFSLEGVRDGYHVGGYAEGVEDDFFNDDETKIISISIASNCINKKLEISVVGWKFENAGVLGNIGAMNKREFFPKSQYFTISLYAGEDKCAPVIDKPDCKYFIEITGDALDEKFSTRKAYEIEPGVIKNESELAGNLLYECDWGCDESWQFLSVTGAVTEAEEACDIKSVAWSPPSVTYSADSRPLVNLKIDTDYCQGKALRISIVSENIAPDTDIEDMHERVFVVPNSGLLEFSFKIGDELCKIVFDPDCSYYVLIEEKDGDDILSTEDSVELSYNCAEYGQELGELAGCINTKKWELQSGPDEITDAGIGTPVSSIEPAPTEDWYCKTVVKGGETFEGPGGKTDVGFDDKEACEKGCKDPGICVRPYKLLEPLPGIGRFIDVSTTTFVGYLTKIFQLAIGIAGVLAVIMLVIGGIEYMATGSITEKGNAKKRIGGAIGGLLLALGAYMILNTINPDLVDFKLFKIETVKISLEGPMEFINGKTCIDTPSPGAPYSKDEQWTTEAIENNIRSFLKSFTTSGGIALNVNVSPSKICLKVGDTNCTSVTGKGDQLSTDYLMAIRIKCPECKLTITGGTECWLHGKDGTQKTFHYPGSPTVDLAPTSSLNKFITGKEEAPGKMKRFDVDGFAKGRFLFEPGSKGGHWHVGP